MKEERLLKKKIKATPNSAALVSVCNDLADYYKSKGDFLKVIKEYEQLSNIHKNNKDMILYAQVSRGIGEAYMSLQDFEQSLRYFTIYHDISLKENNILEQQRALAQLGHLYLTWYLESAPENNLKLLDEAYEYFLKSMKKCESIPESVEKQDMLARLFSNLGLVKENLGDYETALKLYNRSIKICQNHDLYEQMYRGYISMAFLFEKQEKYQEAIKKFNLAIEVAKKLSSNRVELICAVLLSKAQTLIKIADFQAAKQVLRKAYKFKTPNKDDKMLIEKYLRAVAVMCNIEDEIIICGDQRQLKMLYDKMGDAACCVKNYNKAIEYYKKMLAAAERIGASDKELGECYFSLGETYKDIGDYKEAERYLELELNLYKNNLKDCLSTIHRILDVKEMAQDSVESIKSLYEKGFTLCKEHHNLKEERLLAKRYLQYLRQSQCHQEAFKIELHLSKLNDEIADPEPDNSSSESESDDSQKCHIGEDIILSDISDVSDDSDHEVPELTSAQPAKRKKHNCPIKFKKNLNGEWPLHVACIKGDLKRVEYLLQVDHPVNVRDNAGWLPLHEAAVHGYLEIVKLLLDHKATINDRGGSECSGITPIHDAASNGHLEIIELLLNRGASAIAKTDRGNTPLFELKKWRERTEPQFSEEQLTLYNKLVNRMERALEKAGQKETEVHAQEITDFSDNSAQLGRLRRVVDLEDKPTGGNPIYEDPPDYCATSQSAQSASSEYQKVMQNMRHLQATPKTANSQRPNKQAALIDEEDYLDVNDWLEDDIGPMPKRKRRTNSNERWSRHSSFGGMSTSSMSPAKCEDRITTRHELIDLSDVENFDFNESTAQNRRDSISSNESFTKSRRRIQQPTLLDAGFSRYKTKSTQPKATLRRSNSNNSVTFSQQRITNYSTQSAEADSTTVPSFTFGLVEPSPTQRISDSTLFVDVEIEGKLFRLPILMSEINVKTIKWLAGEAAQRFASKEYMKPVLELQTRNGAILGEGDSLNILFPMGSLQAETVIGKVLEWSLPSVLERYKQTCSNMNIDINDDLCDLIQTISISLDLSNRGFLSDELNPLFKALNSQKSITRIDLMGNFLGVGAMSSLCSSIATMSHLETLNLSGCGLRRFHLTQLANIVSDKSITLTALKSLDLSHNHLLKSSSFVDLEVITGHLNVQKLNLCDVGLSDLSNFNGSLQLKHVTVLDISYNALTDYDIKKIASWLDGTVLKSLNVSRNRGKRVLKQILDVLKNESGLALEVIQSEASGVTDSDAFELLSLAHAIASVNFAYNSDLTAITLRRLLQHGGLSCVNVMFCDSIWRLFDPNEQEWSVVVNAISGQAVFKISGENSIFKNAVVEMFRQCYGARLEVEQFNDCLFVTVIKCN